MSDDANGLRRTGAALLDDRLVASDVVRVHVRVDDGVNRLVRQRTDSGNDLRRNRAIAGINQQHAIVADLDGGVDPVDDEHMDAALDVQHAGA